MPFEPLRIVGGGGDDDQRLCPAVQADGTPVWEAGDSNVAMWPAIGLGSCHGALGNQRNHLKIRAHVFLTDSRLVVVSGQFAKGSRHSGERHPGVRYPSERIWGPGGGHAADSP